jgi:hypothetical protein
MKRKGMWADFSDEEIELMLTLRREEEERAKKAAQRAARPKRSTKPRVLEPAPDRSTLSKKKKAGGAGTDLSTEK